MHLALRNEALSSYLYARNVIILILSTSTHEFVIKNYFMQTLVMDKAVPLAELSGRILTSY